MCVLGSTLANFSFNSAYSGLVGSDDLECFYTNRGAWATDCFYACCMCDVSSGFDANKNEVILLANSPVVSSLDGGRTWAKELLDSVIICGNPFTLTDVGVISGEHFAIVFAIRQILFIGVVSNVVHQQLIVISVICLINNQLCGQLVVIF